ncbi:MAG: histidine kinase [Proteobacteria bacterium]|nr:histidine kinase [Pseudomonadota bacterium]
MSAMDAIADARTTGAAAGTPRDGARRILRHALARITPTLGALVVVLILLLWGSDLMRFAGTLQFPLFGRPPHYWWTTLAIDCAVVPTLVAAMLVADACVDAGTPRAPTYVAALIVATLLGLAAQAAVRHALGLHLRQETDPDAAVAAMTPLMLFLDLGLRSAMLVFAYVAVRTAVQERERVRAAERERERLRREAVASELRTLQARIDPRFLLDALAGVASGMDRDEQAANGLLDALIVYLRAAVPNLRQPLSTLGDELQVARAWLAVQRACGHPLPDATTSIAPDLGTAPMPPMLLLPIFAAAIARAADATGPLSIVAQRDGDLLLLDVDVPPPALDKPSTAELVSTLEARLTAIYGAGATRASVRTSPAGHAVIALAWPLPRRHGAA